MVVLFMIIFVKRNPRRQDCTVLVSGQ